MSLIQDAFIALVRNGISTHCSASGITYERQIVVRKLPRMVSTTTCQQGTFQLQTLH